MPFPRRRRVAAALAAALMVDAGIALVFSAPAGAAHPRDAVAGTEEPQEEAVATLDIIEDSVSVRREGKDEFKPAKDGQKLRVGDTIETDATGFAQINYTEDAESFTRLDVNTTFTIESLTDEEGNRKIKGSLENGQTWNRTNALTENETFEQEGAGATAAVSGTAFAYQCDGMGHCTLSTVVDGVEYRTIDGETKALDPLMVCDATEIDETDSDLCDAPEALSKEALLANDWLTVNLYIDGFWGQLPGPVFGTITIENGQVTGVTGSSGTPTVPTPPSEPTAASVSVSLSPSSIEADGSSMSTATATVLDTSNDPLAGETVTFTTTGDVTIGSVTDHGNGTYTATITASNTAGTSTITAHDGPLSGSATLTETAVIDDVRLQIASSAINVGGGDSTLATVFVEDANDDGISGLSVTFTCSGGSPSCDLSFSAVTDNNDGSYTVTITSGNNTGVMQVTAHVGSHSAQHNLNVNNPSS